MWVFWGIWKNVRGFWVCFLKLFLKLKRHKKSNLSDLKKCASSAYQTLLEQRQF